MTRSIFRLHRVLSCLVAPAMIFFAVSGAWQAFRLQQDHKDGYKAPPVLSRLSEAHMAEKLDRGKMVIFRSAQLLVAALFVTTAIVGIVMAFRVAAPRWPVALWLTLGTLVPIALALLCRRSP